MNRDYLKHSNEQQVVNIPTLYIGGPNFGCLPGERLPCVRDVMVFLSPLRRLWEIFGKMEKLHFVTFVFILGVDLC